MDNAVSATWESLPTDPLTMVAAVHGAFFGCTHPAARIEGLIAAHVPRNQITDVADVYENRWWDYRRLSPGHSFYLFAHHYYRATKTAARKMIGERSRGRTAEGKKLMALFGPALVEMQVEDVWEREQAHITGLWKAMLVADALGIPYPEFCRLACKVAIERLWMRLPRPSQLYSEKLAVHVMDEWDILRRSKLVASNHPIYSLANNDDRPMQVAYRAYLIEQIKQVDSKLTALASAIHFRPQITEAEALVHFPAQLIDRARTLAS